MTDIATSVPDAGDGVDNYDWLQAIADNPYLTVNDLCGAYDLLGAKTTLTEDEVHQACYHLVTEGFLEVNSIVEAVDGDVVNYTFHLPGGPQ